MTVSRREREEVRGKDVGTTRGDFDGKVARDVGLVYVTCPLPHVLLVEEVRFMVRRPPERG